MKEDESQASEYIQPHYTESYRLAIFALVSGGQEAYHEYIMAEQIRPFLSDEEITFILENAELPVSGGDSEPRCESEENIPSTYFPAESDDNVPELELGWPEVTAEGADTSISLLFHPPRQNTPTIKEVTRKQIQDARQIIAIAMDVFTDVDIFKDIVSATLKGVTVYILLDDFQFQSFLNMSKRSGVKIQDLKNMRVRTVKGQQYQCRSGAKFHGGLEQKFLLVDCKTVLYGTYSYMWSFEKINLSMVLVVTGQLVASYDEEFRRLFARSSVPAVLSQESESPNAADLVHSPNCTLTSRHQIHMRANVTYGSRSSIARRYNPGPPITRGSSMQDRLHHTHRPGNIVRGHSYAGELQRMNSTSRLRTASQNTMVPGRHRSNLQGREGVNPLYRQERLTSMAEQNLVPFHSESSLNKWKIHSYLNNSDNSLAQNTVISPVGSQFGLNDDQVQLIKARSTEVRSRLEEVRLKRLSLWENTEPMNNGSPGQSQYSLRPLHSPREGPLGRSSLAGLDKRHSMVELDPNMEGCFSLTPPNHINSATLAVPSTLRETQRGQLFPPTHLKEVNRSVSDHDIKAYLERNNTQTFDWHEPSSRTMSSSNLGIKLKESSHTPSSFRPTSLSTQGSRAMASLIEIPEEQEGHTRGSHGSTDKLACESEETKGQNETIVQRMTSVKSTTSARSQYMDRTKSSIEKEPTVVVESRAQRKNFVRSKGTTQLSSCEQTMPGKEEKKDQTQNSMRTPTLPVVEVKETRQEEQPGLQRKHSVKSKLFSLLSSDEHKTLQKEKPFQRKNSLRSKQSTQVDLSVEKKAISDKCAAGKAPDVEQTSSRGQVESASKSHKQIDTVTGTKHHDYPTDRFSSQGPRRMQYGRNVHSGIALEGVEGNISQDRRGKAYNSLDSERRSSDKPITMDTDIYSTDRQRDLYWRSQRHYSSNSPDSYSRYPESTATENRLGRFIQRMGNLIIKK